MIEFIDDDRDAKVVKCITLTAALVSQIKGVVAKHPGTNQSAVVCKILDAYFRSVNETSN